MKPAILVVDDDTAVCELLQDVLSEHVFSVLICHNGQDALRQVQQEPNIALVLLDLIMPEMDGFDAAGYQRPAGSAAAAKAASGATGCDVNRPWQ